MREKRDEQEPEGVIFSGGNGEGVQRENDRCRRHVKLGWA